MYQGEVNIKQEDIASFLKVAEILKIKGLTRTNDDDVSITYISMTIYFIVSMCINATFLQTEYIRARACVCVCVPWYICCTFFIHVIPAGISRRVARKRGALFVCLEKFFSLIYSASDNVPTGEL